MQNFLSMIVLLLASSANAVCGCDAGWEKKALICYKPCANGEKTVGALGFRCEKPCPKEYEKLPHSSSIMSRCRNWSTGDVLNMVYTRATKPYCRI
jgi:hypothetical protein